MKRKLTLKRMVLLLIVMLSISSAYATTYYVDRYNVFGHGSHDNWPGTIEQPKASLQGDWFRRGLDPGDTVIVVGNESYGSMMLYPSSNGTAENPVVIMPYPGHTLLSDAGVFAAQFGVKLLAGVSHVHILGPFKITGREYSYSAEGNNTGLKLADTEIYNCQHGPRLNGTTNSEFRDLQIHDLSSNGFQLRGSLSAATGSPCENILVENVQVWNVDDNRTPDNSDADGFHSFGGENIKFINCSTWGNAEDGFDLNSNSLLVNCKAYNNAACGLKAWRREGDNYAEKTVTVINGIFSNNGNHPADTNPGVKVSMGAGLNLYNCVITNGYDQGLHVRVKLSGSDADPILRLGLSYQKVYVYNTIITGTVAGPAMRDGGYIADSSMPLLVGDYNLYYDNHRVSEGYAIGSHSITGIAPLFADAEALDFRPEAGSPVINSGYNVSAVDALYAQYGLADFNGHARPVQSVIDIGAFEYTNDLAAVASRALHDNAEEEPALSAFPNPFTSELTIAAAGEDAVFEIYTLSGICVKRGKTSEGAINVSDLLIGRYIVKVWTNSCTGCHMTVIKE